ncbi:MAG: rhomboid family intramembrane serine protease [Porticoccus sp.]|nr:rhomboid family intramembrane serine protease [Porticoccus sp.]MBQ0808296.1 rhomboid family intramembrane serine protease [Porticoccus sp.]MDX2349729.1 rhomboid family intramembrane serine protease [Porticoccus sp.]
MTDQSTPWILVAEISHQFDVSDLCTALDTQHISYRINRLEQASELWVEFPEQVPQVKRLLEAIDGQQRAMGRQHVGGMSVQEQLRKMPVIAALLLLSLLGTAIVEWGFTLIHWFTFQDLSIVGDSIRFDTADNAMENGEYWRLVTPIFLHFGLFHIAFNGLWLWELGRRIEPLTGSLQMTMSVLLMAIASNLGQYLWSGPSLFGGMSGVVYGLLGYIWIRHKIAPRPILAIPKGLLGFMLFWLLLGMSGLINLFMDGSIANAAHAIGLVTGMLLGGWAGRNESLD